MALRNIFRDKKKAMIVLGSFIVSIVIFFTINVVIKENDSKSILNETYTYDLQILNEKVSESEAHIITEANVEGVKKISGVANARTIYSTGITLPYQDGAFGKYYKDLYASRYSPGDYDKDISEYKNGTGMDGFFDSKLIAIDDTELKMLTEEAGIQIDLEKFESGEIALTSDFITVSPSGVVGKTISFSLMDSNQEHMIQIAGIVNNPAYFAGGYTPVIIVSQNWFNNLVANPIIELVYVDYTSSFNEATEKHIKELFSDTKNVSYDSKLDLYHDMLGNEKQIRILGNGVGIIIALLAIINYINMMAAGVQNRKKEFATLESIGMTKKQIRVVLVKEGLGYALVSTIISFFIGIPLSYLAFQSMNTYGTGYEIPIVSNSILFLSALLICVIVPPIIFRLSNDGTILEELKAGDE